MDPYLEPHWLDVHTKLVAYAADELNSRLPEDLIASSEERIAVESEDGEERRFGPDVRLIELPPSDAEPADGTTLIAPYRLLAQIEPITERYIRVVEAGTERLITVIEFVSPTNKVGEGLYAFRSKRAQLLAAGVNFVEVDLVRQGNWQVLLQPHHCFTLAISTYRATVRLPADPAAVYLQPISIRERLPEVPIPLRKKDPEIRIDLQQLIDRAYTNGRYARRLSYKGPPAPPLDLDDAQWASELVRTAVRK